MADIYMMNRHQVYRPLRRYQPTVANRLLLNNDFCYVGKLVFFYSNLQVGANAGVVGMTKEHLGEILYSVYVILNYFIVLNCIVRYNSNVLFNRYQVHKSLKITLTILK